MADGNTVQAGLRGSDGEVRQPVPSLELPAAHSRPGKGFLVALLLGLVLAIYWQTTLAMVGVWERSATFTHGFLVIPIFLYLVWRERDVLAAIDPAPNFFALLGIALAGALWLVGEIVSANSVSQFAMIAMVPFAVWSVLGTRVARALAIPLGFLFFAAPVGDFLVPTLMDWTADVTVAAVRASGVPVYREGNYFQIPSGRWSVVEACSGLRYLIASFMIGALYAYLTYRSTARRVTFVVVALAVSIVANWMRAYLIVMLGHLTSNRIAAGADHLVYGWVFFGAIMALLFWVGTRWREDGDPAPAPVRASPADTGAHPRGRETWAAGIAAIVLMALWQPLEAWISGDGIARPVQVSPVAGSGGWIAVRDDVSTWRPEISNARAELRQTFEKEGARVGLHLSFFRDQTRDTKGITSQNQLVSTSSLRWKKTADGTVSLDIDGQPFRFRTNTITDERERIAAWQWFWVDGRVTSNEYLAKLYQAFSEMRGHGDPVAWVIVYTRIDDSEPNARALLQSFSAAMMDSVDAELRRAAAQ